jgi:hypothetical protein
MATSTAGPPISLMFPVLEPDRFVLGEDIFIVLKTRESATYRWLTTQLRARMPRPRYRLQIGIALDLLASIQ